MVYEQCVVVADLLAPAAYALIRVHDPFGERKRSPARMVEFVDMVYLFHRRAILRKSGHEGGQIAIEGEEYVHADAEIRRPEKCRFSGVAYLLDLSEARSPAGRAAHHRNSLCESGVYVVKGCGGSCELDRHVGRAESVGVDRGVAVVDVYMSHYLMAALKRYLFYRMAHLAIPYQCYFHLVSDIMSQKYKKTRRVELLFTLVNSRFVPCPGCRRWLTTALRAGGSGCEVARTMPDRGAAWRCRP